MIKTVDNTIFEIENARILINTINCVGTMGKGLALEFKQKYPKNFLEYKKLCNNNKIKIGNLFWYKENNTIIINFPTKKNWQDKSEYNYIQLGLEELKDLLQTFSRAYYNQIIAIPKLGCNNGGLDWKIVKQMIETELKNIDLKIYLCEKDI